MTSENLFKEATELMQSAGFRLSPEEERFLRSAAEWPNVWAQTISSLYSSKLLERSSRALARSNDKQANRMVWLTCALVVFAAVEAIATAMPMMRCL